MENKDETIVDTEYGVDQIGSLEGLQAIRKRPGMYIGSTSQKGITHLVYEVSDNSFDEYVAGHGKIINITVDEDSSVSVEDFARGIPVGPHHTWKDDNGEPLDTLTGILTKMHAGGKFNSADSGYKCSSGLHGIGVTAVNALSDKLTVIVKRYGNIYKQEFSKGDPITPVEIVGKDDSTGTKITYHPDPSIFKMTLEPSCKELQTRLSELASLNAGVIVNYKNKITNVDQQYHFEDGIIGYNKRLIGDKISLFDNPLYFNGTYELPNNKIIISEISFIYDDEVEANQVIKTFANNINTYEGGYHLKGFRDEYKRIINEYGIENKLIEESKQLEIKYLLDGIYAIISVKVPEAEFEGQTKTKLGNAEAQFAVAEALRKGFAELIKKQENKDIIESIIIRALNIRQTEEAMRKARSSNRKVSKISKMGLPGKLADCSNKSGYREIYLVEGDSAAGCHVGDTLIDLVDGRSIRLDDLVEEFEAGIKNYVYSSKPNGEITVQPIIDAFKTKHVSKLCKIVLDNGEIIKCTPEHPYMLKNGTFKEAQYLTKTDSLMPLYKKVAGHPFRLEIGGDLYEYVLNNNSNKYYPTHRLVADQYLGKHPKNTHIHHKDINSKNNEPENLEYKDSKEHIRFHQKEWFSHQENVEKFKETMSNATKKMWENPEYREKQLQNGLKKLAEEKRGLLYAHREKMKNDPEYFEKNWKKLHTLEAAEKRKESLKKFFNENPEAKEHLSEVAKEQWNNKELLEWRSKKTSEQMNQPGYMDAHKNKIYKKKQEHAMVVIKQLINDGIEVNNNSYDAARTLKEQPKWKTLRKYFGNDEGIKEWIRTYNHRIVSVEIIEEEADVYDLTVPPYNNFALSAGIFVHNSAKEGRYKKFQAVLALRGKLLNTEKADYEKMLNSETIKYIIASLGAGVGDTFDVNEVRYEKVCIMTDADDDGAHICLLLITFFYKYMTDLIRKGLLYATVPPLYRVIKNGKSLYLKDDHDLKEYKEKNKGNFDLKRFKGLGEMNPEQLKETTMDPKTRILKRIVMEDAEKAAETIKICMGKESDIRRDFIEANAFRIQLD